jgi:hypothetical protein
MWDRIRKICWSKGRQSLLACLIWVVVSPGLSVVWGQLGGIPRTVTLKNGAQFEGQIYSVSSVGGLDAYPQDAKPVVVVDDGLRLLFFNQKRIARTGDAVTMQNEISIPIWQKTHPGDSSGYGFIEAIGPFDEYGHRRLTVRDDTGTTTLIQGITEIGPRHCEVRTLSIPRAIPGDDRRMRDWTMEVGTGSIPIDVLRSLLRRQVQDDDSALEQLQIVQFFVQAQQFRRALEELRLIQRQPKFQGIQDELEERRNSIRQSEARWWLREVRTRLDSGQSNFALQLVDAFNKEGIASEILAEFAAVRSQILEQLKLVEQSRQNIVDLVAEAVSSNQLDEPQVEIVRRFQNELETELDPANLDRLASYQRFMNDESTKIDRKLALAISGWLLGSNYAIDNLAIAQSLFPVRDIVREYLTCKDPGRRSELITELENYEGGEPQYLAELLENMKPPLAPDLENYTGEQPIEFFVEVPGTKENPQPRQFQCLAHLPPQYDPYRKYPCIITLRAGVTTETQLDRWCGDFNSTLGVRTGPAMRNGYIVVSVDWKQEGQSVYTYSAREHAIVLRALKQALGMFSIDSDRVFLHGHDIGATAAYDIGISHPEHWAGIIGIGGVIDRYPNQYSRNVHVGLPVYSVVGQKDIAARNLSKRAWDVWCTTDRYVDCVVVMYKGRGNVSYGGGPTAETFPEELPHILNWMAAQRRKLPDKSGFEFECDVLRPWDNYFWFWQLHGFPESNVTRPEHWIERGHDPLTISGQLKANSPNRFYVGPSNLGTGGTLWLSPEFVDFDQKIVVGGRGDFSGFVQPSRAVLLEDVRLRGDRQHPYWAKIECNGKRWDEDK